MEIGFEAKRLFSNFTGLGNYSRFIVDALSKSFPEHEYYLYSPKSNHHSEVTAITDRSNVHPVHPDGLFAKSFLSAIWRSWLMSSHPSVTNLSIFHGLSQEFPSGLPASIKKVVTVHDLIFLRYPQFYSPIDVRIYKAKVSAACNAADKIVAISQQTAGDIQLYLGEELRSKIEVVYQGAHPIFSNKHTQQESDAVKLKYNLPSEYILTVGTIEERKNLLLLIKAMSKLPSDVRIPLVVIGRKTEYLKLVMKAIAEYKLSSLVIFLHKASFIDFPAIYQGTTAFVYPSLFEGFGIPLVEAIESGVPVITSTGSCFSEAAGPDAIYVNPLNYEELAVRLAEVITDTALRNRMTTASSDYILKFRPEVVAREMMKVYASIL